MKTAERSESGAFAQIQPIADELLLLVKGLEALDVRARALAERVHQLNTPSKGKPPHGAVTKETLELLKSSGLLGISAAEIRARIEMTYPNLHPRSVSSALSNLARRGVAHRNDRRWTYLGS